MKGYITIEQLAFDFGLINNEQLEDASKIPTDFDWSTVFDRLKDYKLPPTSIDNNLYVKSRGITILFDNKEYAFKSPIYLYKSLHLLGCGGYGLGAGTILAIKHDMPGIVSYRDDSNIFSTTAIIEKLSIIGIANGSYPTDPKDYNHGILSFSPIKVTDCFISGFGGNGIHIESSTNGTGKNTDLWKLNNIEIIYCKNGLFIIGPDSQVGVATSINTHSNKHYGICDCADLGNTFIACHSSYNGFYVADGVFPNEVNYFRERGGFRSGDLIIDPIPVSANNTAIISAVLNELENQKLNTSDTDLIAKINADIENIRSADKTDRASLIDAKIFESSDTLNLVTNFGKDKPLLKTLAFVVNENNFYIEPLRQSLYNKQGKEITVYNSSNNYKSQNSSTVFIGCYAEDNDFEQNVCKNFLGHHTFSIASYNTEHNMLIDSDGQTDATTAHNSSNVNGGIMTINNGAVVYSVGNNWNNNTDFVYFDANNNLVKGEKVLELTTYDPDHFNSIKNNYSIIKFLQPVILTDNNGNRERPFQFERKLVTTSTKTVRIVPTNDDNNPTAFNSIENECLIERKYYLFKQIDENGNIEWIKDSFSFKETTINIGKQKEASLFIKFNNYYNTWDFNTKESRAAYFNNLMFTPSASQDYNDAQKEYLETKFIDRVPGNTRSISLDGNCVWVQNGIYIGSVTGGDWEACYTIKIDAIHDIDDLWDKEQRRNIIKDDEVWNKLLDTEKIIIKNDPQNQKKYLIGEIRFNKNPVKGDPKQGYAGWIYCNDEKWYPFGKIEDSIFDPNTNPSTNNDNKSVKDYIKEHLPKSIVNILFGIINDTPGLYLTPNGVPIPINPEWNKQDNISLFVAKIISLLTHLEIEINNLEKKELLTSSKSSKEIIVYNKVKNVIRSLSDEIV